MPRARKRPRALCALMEMPRPSPLQKALDREFLILLSQHRAVNGLGLSGKFRLARVSEQIALLFYRVLDADLEVIAFARRGLGEEPPPGTPEAANHAEILAMSIRIAEGYRRPPGLPPINRSL